MSAKRVKTLPLRSDFGWFDPDTKQIALSDILKESPVPSKALILNHELFHLWIDKHKVKLNPAEEELACYIYSLFKCKPFQLSYLESYLKKTLIKELGYRPSKKNILLYSQKK